MSDDIQYIDVDDDEYLDAPKALRDQVKKLQRTLDKVKGERDSVRTKLNERAFADVLADKGFKNPTRVQKDMLSDQVDPSDADAVNAWLAANSDDYARVDGSADPDPAPAADEQPDPDAQNYERLAVPGQTPAGSVNAYEAAMAEVGKDASKEELRAAFIKHGL